VGSVLPYLRTVATILHARTGRGEAPRESAQAWHRLLCGFTLTAEDTREAYGERRFLTLGLLEDQVVSIAHTERGEDIRIISIRKATKHEARFYFSQVID
jgi:uncharacterized DUF497 family protein